MKKNEGWGLINCMQEKVSCMGHLGSGEFFPRAIWCGR